MSRRHVARLARLKGPSEFALGTAEASDEEDAPQPVLSVSTARAHVTLRERVQTQERDDDDDGDSDGDGDDRDDDGDDDNNGGDGNGGGDRGREGEEGEEEHHEEEQEEEEEEEEEHEQEEEQKQGRRAQQRSVFSLLDEIGDESEAQNPEREAASEDDEESEDGQEEFKLAERSRSAASRPPRSKPKGKAKAKAQAKEKKSQRKGAEPTEEASAAAALAAPGFVGVDADALAAIFAEQQRMCSLLTVGSSSMSIDEQLRKRVGVTAAAAVLGDNDGFGGGSDDEEDGLRDAPRRVRRQAARRGGRAAGSARDGAASAEAALRRSGGSGWAFGEPRPDWSALPPPPPSSAYVRLVSLRQEVPAGLAAAGRNGGEEDASPDAWPAFLNGRVCPRWQRELSLPAAAPAHHQSQHQIAWFSLAWSRVYQQEQRRFEYLRDHSYDPSALAEFLTAPPQQYPGQHPGCRPYHLDALLQLAMVFLHSGGGGGGYMDRASDLVRRCLFYIEQVAPFKPAASKSANAFQPLSGWSRLDPSRPENSAVFSAIMRHMQLVHMLGMPSVALPIARTLLALEPLCDPMNALLWIDGLALGARKFEPLYSFEPRVTVDERDGERRVLHSLPIGYSAQVLLIRLRTLQRMDERVRAVVQAGGAAPPNAFCSSPETLQTDPAARIEDLPNWRLSWSVGHLLQGAPPPAAAGAAAAAATTTADTTRSGGALSRDEQISRGLQRLVATIRLFPFLPATLVARCEYKAFDWEGMFSRPFFAAEGRAALNLPATASTEFHNTAFRIASIAAELQHKYVWAERADFLEPMLYAACSFVVGVPVPGRCNVPPRWTTYVHQGDVDANLALAPGLHAPLTDPESPSWRAWASRTRTFHERVFGDDSPTTKYRQIPLSEFSDKVARLPPDMNPLDPRLVDPRVLMGRMRVRRQPMLDQQALQEREQQQLEDAARDDALRQLLAAQGLDAGGLMANAGRILEPVRARLRELGLEGLADADDGVLLDVAQQVGIDVAAIARDAGAVDGGPGADGVSPDLPLLQLFLLTLFRPLAQVDPSLRLGPDGLLMRGGEGEGEHDDGDEGEDGDENEGDM